MNQLVRFHLADGRSFAAELEPQPGVAPAGATGRVVDAAIKSVEETLDVLRPAAEAVLERLTTLARRPDGIEMEFGIKLNAEAGAVFAKTAAEGHFKITLSWKASSGE